MRAAPSRSPSAQRYILRVRTLASAVAQTYYESREALGFPLLKSAAARAPAGNAA